MSRITQGQERVRLEQELEEATFTALLEALREREPRAQTFGAWADVLRFMRDQEAAEADRDALLAAMLQAQAADANPRWRTVLLAAFWPRLEKVLARRRGWDADPEECWQNLIAAFLGVVARTDGLRRSYRLCRKLINDTAHRLHDHYRRAWKQADLAAATDTDELSHLAAAGHDADIETLDQRVEQEHQLKRFRLHLQTGRISEADFALLVGTRIFGRRVRDCADELGLSLEAAKKRRQRVEALMGRLEATRKK